MQPDGWELVQQPLSDHMNQSVEEYRVTGPDRSNLKQALLDFRKKNKDRYPNFIPKLSNASEEELQKRMQHADACLTAMAQVILEEENKPKCMYDTIKSHVETKRGRRRSPDMQAHLQCICDVNETDPEKLTNAYRALLEIIKEKKAEEGIKASNGKNIPKMSEKTPKKVGEKTEKKSKKNEISTSVIEGKSPRKHG